MATDLDAKLISQGTQISSVNGTALVSVATAEGQPQNNITVAGLADSMGAQAAESVNITSLWGQTADGKMVRITNQSAANIIGNLLYGATNKNDLATVVAGTIGFSTHNRWKSLTIDKSVEIDLLHQTMLLCIGHIYFGMGIYSLSQDSQPKFVGGTDNRNTLSFTITNTASKITITNGNVQQLEYKFL